MPADSENICFDFSVTDLSTEGAKESTGFFVALSDQAESLPDPLYWRMISSIKKSIEQSGMTIYDIVDKVDDATSGGIAGLCLDALFYIEHPHQRANIQDSVFHALKALFIAGIETPIKLKGSFFRFTHGGLTGVEAREVTDCSNIMTLVLPEELSNGFHRSLAKPA